MNPRVKEVHFQSPHFLVLTFTNQEVRRFSFQMYTSFPVYRKLQNEAFARKAHCRNGTVAWDEMIDFDPDTLYLESEPISEEKVKMG